MTSRILVIGGTGTIGQHLVTASLNAGHPTAMLVRSATVSADSGKAKLLESLKASGATVLYGDMNDHASLVAAIKQHADVVISAVGVGHGTEELDGQLKIVQAIKDAGNVKRFVPSEYGCDVEQAELTLEPAKTIVAAKVQIRQAVRAAGIPHTFICSYWPYSFMLPRLGNPEEDGPPTTRATIFGDDQPRVIFVNEKDMSIVAIKAVNDPRTLDKILYIRPPTNTCSFSHLVHLWEKKIGKTLEKHYVSEEELAKKVQGSPFPLNFQLAMVHSTLVSGVCEQTINASIGVEATQLYPDMKYITVEEYLEGLL